MISTLIPTFTIAATVLGALRLSGVYGIALASTGLLSCLGFTLATDAYGPVADNAGGIAEMADLPPEVRDRTDVLDALGNTTAAVGKGFAIGSAVLTGLSLLSVFKSRLDISPFDPISDEFALSGLLIGSMVPFLFSALTMSAVAKAASAVVYEVRRQFAEHPGIMQGTEKPNYARCIRMTTASSLHGMLLPGMITILFPIVSGLAFPAAFLAGLLLGEIATGFMLSMMMAAAGGAWDNAKKYIEGGQLGGKRSDSHKAAVVGDTVGDPFKDTSGPSINILIKLSTYMSVVLAPVFQDRIQYWWASLIVLAVGLAVTALLLIATPEHYKSIKHWKNQRKEKKKGSALQPPPTETSLSSIPSSFADRTEPPGNNDVELEEVSIDETPAGNQRNVVNA